MTDSSSFLSASSKEPEAVAVVIAAASVIKKAFLFEPVIDLIITGLTQDITQQICKQLEFEGEQDFMKDPDKVRELLEALQKEPKIYEGINLSSVKIEPKLAGSFGNTFFTMNRISCEYVEVNLPFELKQEEGQPYSSEIYKQMTTELGKEPLYIEENSPENPFIKVMCFSNIKKMLSSGMSQLTITSDDLKIKLEEYGEVYIEGFLLANNFATFFGAIEKIDSEKTKINLTLSSKYMLNFDEKEREELRKQRWKNLRELIGKGKIKEIYGNDEEIEALFGSLPVFQTNKDKFLTDYSNNHQITILETKGKNGAVLYYKGTKIEVPALYLRSDELKLGNVMGAGDTFLAGFLKAREILGEDNIENLEMALKFGTILATEVLKIPEGSLSKGQITNIFGKNQINSKFLEKIVKERYDRKPKNLLLIKEKEETSQAISRQ